jgi:DNA-binding transcriptional LysR family regulator
LAELEARAPLAALELHMSDDRTFEHVIAGRIDVGMVSVGDPPSILRREKLFDDQYVCIVAKDHPSVRGRRFGLRQYVEQRHVVIDVEHGMQPAIERPLAMLGTRRRIGYRTPFLSSAVYAAAATSLVLTVPRRLAETCVTGVAVRVVAAPPELDRFSYSLVWHNRLEASTAHSWFRDRIRSVAAVLTQSLKRR